jgi:phosphatidate cytidylyltransferase
MAMQASDVWRRLYGALLFLPILVPVLMGQSYSVLGLGIAAIWLSAEFSVMMRNTGYLRLSGLPGFLASIAALSASFVAGIYYGLADEQAGSIILVASLIMMVALSRFYLFACLLSVCLFSLGIISQIESGVPLILFVAIVISACDIGAYCSGRIIGGAKLAPAISPSKTWSGSIGGMIGGTVTGYGALIWFGSKLGVASPYIVGWIILITILSQLGDLYESWLKRQLNIKDSSQLIPGHGGVLDRFDGYLIVLPVVVLAQYQALLFAS